MEIPQGFVIEPDGTTARLRAVRRNFYDTPVSAIKHCNLHFARGLSSGVPDCSLQQRQQLCGDETLIHFWQFVFC
jgi:hypothetical protein